MKKGLVLEGGGIRGIFTAGVLDVMMEEGIRFDGAIGVSAGAAFGCNFKSGQKRRAIRYNLNFARDPRYSSVWSLLVTGDLFGAQFCYHEIPEKLDPFDWKAFRENPMSFYLVCTDVETGLPVYHCCDRDPNWEMLEWFRASGSMPLVSRIVEIGRKKLLDGGVADSIPLRFMEGRGYSRNVVILTRPDGYVKKPAPLMPVIRRSFRMFPAFVQAFADRPKVYNETIEYIRRREQEGAVFVIRPEKDLAVGRVEHDRDRIRAAYKEGRRTARKLLPALCAYLGLPEPQRKKNNFVQPEEAELFCEDGVQAEKSEPVREAGVHPEGSEPVREAGVRTEGSEPFSEAGVQAEGSEPVREAGVQAEKSEPVRETGVQSEEAESFRGTGVQAEKSETARKDDASVGDSAGQEETKVKTAAEASAAQEMTTQEQSEQTGVSIYRRARRRKPWKAGNMDSLRQRSRKGTEK